MNFFQLLKKRTRVEPSKDFDRRFWARFESEFGQGAKVSRRRPWQGPRLVAGLAMAAAAGIAVIVFWPETERRPDADPVIAQVELLEDMEILELLDEDGTVTEAEWSMLLEGVGKENS